MPEEPWETSESGSAAETWEHRNIGTETMNRQNAFERKRGKEALGERKVYTSGEVSDMLGVSKNAVHRMIREGLFESLKLSGKYYIKKKSFEEWLDDPDRIVLGEEHAAKQEGEKGAGDMNDTRCYTVNEVKQMLGISRKAVYELLSRNEFSYVVAGGKYLISKNSFNNWLDHSVPDPEKNKSL